MATAIYHSDRGESSALLQIKKHELEMSHQIAYTSRKALEGKEVGDEFPIPDNFELIDWVDGKTGEVRTTKNGEPLKVLKFN